MAIGKFLFSCYMPNSFLFASLIHASAHGGKPDTERTFVLKRQLGDNPQLLTGRRIYTKSSKYRVEDKGTRVWEEKVADIGKKKNEASFPKHVSLVIIPRAIAWKQTTKMNIMPCEINVILAFWVNKVLRFHKTETQWKNIHDCNFWNINDEVWYVLREEGRVCVCMKSLSFYLTDNKHHSAWFLEAA